MQQRAGQGSAPQIPLARGRRFPLCGLLCAPAPEVCHAARLRSLPLRRSHASLRPGRILLTCNQPEFAPLPPGQIVPILADLSLYNSSGEDFIYGSERSFYRVLHAHGQAHRRGRARPPQEPREVPRL